MRAAKWILPTVLAVGIAVGAGVWGRRRTEAIDPNEVLRRARQAVESTSYVAVVESVVSCAGRGVQSRGVLRVAPGGRRRIVYTHGDLKGAMSGCDRRTSWRYDPRKHRMVVHPHVCDARSEVLTPVSHRSRLEGSGEIAGRPTHIVSLSAYGERSVRRRYWVDKETFIPLRTDEYGPTGRLVSRTTFLSVEFAPSEPEVFAPPHIPGVKIVGETTKPTRCASLAELSRKVGYRAVLPRYVPKGMRVIGYYYHSCPCCKRAAPVIRYSDGASSFTIYQCAPGCGLPDRTEKVFWGGRLATVATKHGHYTIVGEIPGRELRKVAASLAR